MYDESREAKHETGQPRRVGDILVPSKEGVEFNMLYRWHPTMSQADEQWIQSVFQNIFKDKPIDQVTTGDFGKAMRVIQAQESPDLSMWTFGKCVCLLLDSVFGGR